MRARNIKPALFKNELLGQADPLNTLLFVGLWCAADREGRVEDRPARLRAELFPYRPGFGIETALVWLQEAGFIDRYRADDTAIIQVLKFAEHQRPHKNEVPSVLPAKVESAARQGRKRARPKNGQGEKGVALIPSCLDASSLNPDTGYPIPESPLTALPPLTEIEISKCWKAILSAYPKGQPRHDRSSAKKHAIKLVADGKATWLQLHVNVRAYADCCHINQRKVMDIRTFFSAEDEPWRNTWPLEGIRSPGLDAEHQAHDREAEK